MHQSNPVSAWFSVGADVWLLCFEAAAHAEAQRMVGEKMAALFELQQLAFAGKLGETAPDAVGKTIAHYRRAVRANRRRLTR
ncbi:hypothetical protein GON01_03345 [Sphingomonas sp. MAH-20]|uniref:Uncharacterized protein n=1 Tax=Sphingomonas horti TaxID=2682842 RepID=A0A6I4IYK1_9SPHN|nr:MULTISPECIES: hypothetical protein [Sphingomonas]MBA2920998.1 hypothetical protein [Sphingomonas sp. CGMCC 1.13658]MVO76973.1 hypothetical protein [Sphingomonas horti]